jgi:hypothetical protein
LKIRTLFLLLLAALATAAAAQDEKPEPVRLFHIERNTNANIVVYDLLFEKDGNVKKKDPIDVYWLRLAEDGKRKDLKGIERRMAYGYKEADRRDNVLVIEMRADIGRRITISPIRGEHRARIDIDGRPAILDKVFIHATEGGVLPSVDYIELHGTDVETGELAVEKFAP